MSKWRSRLLHSLTHSNSASIHDSSEVASVGVRAQQWIAQAPRSPSRGIGQRPFGTIQYCPVDAKKFRQDSSSKVLNVETLSPNVTFGGQTRPIHGYWPASLRLQASVCQTTSSTQRVFPTRGTATSAHPSGLLTWRWTSATLWRRRVEPRPDSDASSTARKVARAAQAAQGTRQAA